MTAEEKYSISLRKLAVDMKPVIREGEARPEVYEEMKIKDGLGTQSHLLFLMRHIDSISEDGTLPPFDVFWDDCLYDQKMPEVVMGTDWGLARAVRRRVEEEGIERNATSSQREVKSAGAGADTEDEDEDEDEGEDEDWVDIQVGVEVGVEVEVEDWVDT
ncbi:hypothetical protein MBM_02745 [Drepanopeziza brunnea f. sp. 'multigermtubi' MB_m1]|uniref:Uncharacterized protein n=1 Tax=Marssonina brunnea f. sp. multigermtubi (strain MB_m1) TaxID=1072389 RepID=K1XF51_MARBU|nr:uncharacterized protein MBM_02745 [Drepanopeziza brunnea f. sp. 'multigermtubi' MB_m1]EKD19508.1 hypothetical protein MBM_02745 [Drepanopeziza brunnea f. sp. 'multigermtubi' MB_m1]